MDVVLGGLRVNPNYLSIIQSAELLVKFIVISVTSYALPSFHH